MKRRPISELLWKDRRWCGFWWNKLEEERSATADKTMGGPWRSRSDTLISGFFGWAAGCSTNRSLPRSQIGFVPDGREESVTHCLGRSISSFVVSKCASSWLFETRTGCLQVRKSAQKIIDGLGRRTSLQEVEPWRQNYQHAPNLNLPAALFMSTRMQIDGFVRRLYSGHYVRYRGTVGGRKWCPRGFEKPSL